MKTKTRLLTLILPSLLLAGTSGAVIAADEPAKPASDAAAQSNQPATPSADAAAQMKTLDPDNDGTVSKAEAAKMKGLPEAFDMADKNKDGLLDTAELATALSQIKK